MTNDIIKLHISGNERIKWNKAASDVENIINGNIILPLANGTRPGYSLNNFTNEYKAKLDSIELGANRYVHPPTHPASMITGLATVATTGDYNHLINKPTRFIADGGNSDTVGNIRVTISESAPWNPNINREIWINPRERLIKIFTPNGWENMHAVWS